jgi:hypothetical protein
MNWRWLWRSGAPNAPEKSAGGMPRRRRPRIGLALGLAVAGSLIFMRVFNPNQAPAPQWSDTEEGVVFDKTHVANEKGERYMLGVRVTELDGSFRHEWPVIDAETWNQFTIGDRVSIEYEQRKKDERMHVRKITPLKPAEPKPAEPSSDSAQTASLQRWGVVLIPAV